MGVGGGGRRSLWLWSWLLGEMESLDLILESILELELELDELGVEFSKFSKKLVTYCCCVS